jgi:drug/metabolite transporter (DMT)-like permease
MTTAAPATPAALPRARQAFPWTDLSLVLMACIWGGNFAVMKLGAQQFPPLAFNALRITAGTVVLLALAAAQGTAAWPRRSVAWRLVLLGVIGNGFYQVFFVNALVRTSIANTAIMIASTPVWLAILGQLKGTEHFTRRAWAGVVLSILGVVLVLFGGGRDAAPHSWVGDLLAMGGVASWCTYTVLLRPYTQDTPPVPLHALTLVGGAVPLLLLAARDLVQVPYASVSVGGWLALAYGALMAIVLAYLLWYRGVRLIGPTRTAMFANLQPIVALVVAAAMLGEFPTVAQGAGCALTVGGLLLTRS